MKHTYIITSVIILFVLLSCQEEKQPELETTPQLIADTLKSQDSINPLTTSGALLLKQLIHAEIKGQEFRDLKTSPFSVFFPNEDDPYSVYLSIVASDDFSNDGITDYIVLRNSEGMMGGNVNTNQEYLFLVMKDENTVKEKHSILAYAPLSYNILENASYENKQFTIEVTQNFRSYVNEDLQSASLSFVYKKGNIYEASYLTKCALAKLQSKTIFKAIPHVKNRTRSIDMNDYTETIHEVYQSKGIVITADLAGCDNLSLTFNTAYSITIEQQNDAEYKKSLVIQLLQFLAQNTQFTNEIQVLLDYYENNGVTDAFVKLDSNYNFRILIQKDKTKEERLRYLVQINKMDNPNQSKNWAVATRQK